MDDPNSRLNPNTLENVYIYYLLVLAIPLPWSNE